MQSRADFGWAKKPGPLQKPFSGIQAKVRGETSIYLLMSAYCEVQ